MDILELLMETSTISPVPVIIYFVKNNKTLELSGNAIQ